MSHGGEARALPLSFDVDGVVAPTDETLRLAREVARATLDEARREAQEIRAAARKDAAKMRAQAEASAKRYEAKLDALETQVEALTQQLSTLEATRSGATGPDIGVQNVIAGSRGVQVGSLASSLMPGRPSSSSNNEASVTRPHSGQGRLSGRTGVDVERARLLAEIAATKRRIEKIGAGASRRAEVERELGSLVLAAYDELASIEREHEVRIDAIRGDAREEVTRILEGASEQATAVHARAADTTDRSDSNQWAPS